MQRREFLKASGALSIFAAGGGVWRAYDRGVWNAGDGAAYEPWSEWRTEPAEGPLALVRAGILAANPHNTQPWLFRVTPSKVELFADTTRHLGAFDPYRREMYLGLGCAIENMMLAARAHGYDPRLDFRPGTLDPPPAEGKPVPVASIALRSGAPEATQLHAAIPRRHTNRGPYDRHRPIPTDVLSGLIGSEPEDGAVRVVVITDRDARARLGELIVASTEAIIADSEMVHDSERWYRHSRSEVEAHRDGPTLDATGLPPMRIAIAKLLPRPSAHENHTYWLNNTRDIQVATAPAYGLVLVRQLYDREQSLRAGRAWQRKHLWATSQGLAMQPLNQPVELFDRQRSLGRVSPIGRELAAFAGQAGWEPTFVFRFGYPAQPAGPSPRRSADDVVI